MRIDVSLTVTGDTVTKTEYFDVWHHTAKGNTYKRSDQYTERRFGVAAAEAWFWEGRRATGHNTSYMKGQLTLTSGAYVYKEWRFHGSPGPQTTGEEVISAVCKEARQIIGPELSGTTIGKRRVRVVDASEGFLNIRNGPGPTYQEIAKMPVGATGLVGRCIPLDGSWKPFCQSNGKA